VVSRRSREATRAASARPTGAALSGPRLQLLVATVVKKCDYVVSCRGWFLVPYAVQPAPAHVRLTRPFLTSAATPLEVSRMDGLVCHFAIVRGAKLSP
jgi:hypothetical protein